ncbi:hypothetical protein HYV10_01050 [Candidatus Dependentiae bacterium]|nr:hypothetical protein [Candidatus Dependentiae bacterium]
MGYKKLFLLVFMDISYVIMGSDDQEQEFFKRLKEVSESVELRISDLETVLLLKIKELERVKCSKVDLSEMLVKNYVSIHDLDDFLEKIITSVSRLEDRINNFQSKIKDFEGMQEYILNAVRSLEHRFNNFESESTAKKSEFDLRLINEAQSYSLAILARQVAGLELLITRGQRAEVSRHNGNGRNNFSYIQESVDLFNEFNRVMDDDEAPMENLHTALPSRNQSSSNLFSENT